MSYSVEFGASLTITMPQSLAMQGPASICDIEDVIAIGLVSYCPIKLSECLLPVSDYCCRSALLW